METPSFFTPIHFVQKVETSPIKHYIYTVIDRTFWFGRKYAQVEKVTEKGYELSQFETDGLNKADGLNIDYLSTRFIKVYSYFSIAVKLSRFIVTRIVEESHPLRKSIESQSIKNHRFTTFIQIGSYLFIILLIAKIFIRTYYTYHVTRETNIKNTNFDDVD